jgi:integrase
VTAGIEVRHRKHCAAARDDGKCCDAGFRAQAFDKRTGKTIRRTFTTRAAAKQWRQDAQVALRHGTIVADRGPTLQEAAGQWLEGARDGHIRNRSGDPYKPSAIRGYEQNLAKRVLPDLGRYRLGELRHRDLQRLVDRLVADGAHASTITTTITPLRAIYRRALTRGVVDRNPTRGLELPAVRSKPRRFADPREAERLLAALDPDDRALWATALYAGLRRGELVALRHDDVDLATGVIHVHRGWDAIEGEIGPKSRQGRRKVPVPAVLRDHLLEHRIRTDRAGHVFGSLGRVCRQAKDAATTWRQAGLEPITLHGARHTYASLMIAAGVNAKALSTFMGHANIAVTLDLYGHLMPGSEDEAAGMLDSYLASKVRAATIPPAIPPPRIASIHGA